MTKLHDYAPHPQKDSTGINLWSLSALPSDVESLDMVILFNFFFKFEETLSLRVTFFAPKDLRKKKEGHIGVLLIKTGPPQLDQDQPPKTF